MTRRKINKRDIRNILKVKSTYYVSIPVQIIRDFRWQERQKVRVKKFGKNKIIIEDWTR